MIPTQMPQGIQQPQIQGPQQSMSQQPLQGMPQMPSQSPRQKLQQLEQAKIQIDKVLSNESLTPEKFKQVYQVKLQVDSAIKDLQQGPQGMPQSQQPQGMVSSLMSGGQPMAPLPMQQQQIPPAQPLQGMGGGMGELPNTGFVQNILRQLDSGNMLRGMR